MGGAKSEWMDRMQNGYSSGSGKNVCISHIISDRGLRSFIRDNRKALQCSYCGSNRSIPLDTLIAYIMKKVSLYYDDPNNGDGVWDDENHQWMEEYDTTQEIVFWQHGLELSPYLLQQDIERAFDDSLWIRRNPYGGSPDDEQYYDWYYFADMLKHHMRFTFYKSAVRRSLGSSDFMVRPDEILYGISKLINRFRLFSEFKKVDRKRFYRARQHDRPTRILKGGDLGSAPVRYAKANRFSPAGISMLYVAEDRETALQETVYPDSQNTYITSGAFVLQRDIRVIDLTKVKRVTIFDERREKDYFPLQFLERFIDHISAPVTGNNAEHIDYVPTQMITEFFRYLMNGKSRRPIDGLCYNSVKNNQRCYVLFLDESNFTQDDEDRDGGKAMCLKLDSVRRKKITTILSS